MPKQFTGVRDDGFIDVPKKCDNPIQEHWIHKECVVKTGKGDDEFVIVHKPFMVDSVDLDKRIHEEAKGTDLKSLIQQVIRTGDATLLNQKQGNYVDITGYPEDTMTAMNNLVRGNDILGMLPDDLKSKSLEDLINMTDEDIGSYVKESIAKAVKGADGNKSNEEVVEPTAPIVKEGDNNG